MNRLIDNNRIYYTYCYVHEDGQRQFNHYLHILRKMVKDYKKANNFPISGEFEAEFEDNLCRNSNKPDLCREHIPPSLLEKASSFARAAAKWVKSGFKVRSEEEVNRIISICKTCPEYNGDTGFLKVACKACGCSKLKLWMVGSSCPIQKW